MHEILTALVVDDEPMQRQITGRMLRILGVEEVVETDDGGQALSIIDSHGGAFDLVVSDLDMPKMDGMEFLRRLAEIPHAPAVIINSSHNVEIINSVDGMARAYGLRVLGSLEKPLKRAKLEELLESASRETPGQPARQSRRPNELDLHECLAERRFIPFFQPKLRFGDGIVASAETLIRLQLHDGEILTPALFMTEVVSEGLITDVTLAFFETTLAVLTEMRDGGLTPDISFNLSAESLDDVSFSVALNKRVSEAGLDPRSLTFELVESEIARDFRRATENTTRLRMQGFGLSIDDFGTGFSTLEQLGRLPFTELKVDQSFVTGICDNPQKQAMVNSTVKMAKDLDLIVVAEGVETEGEADYVHNAGCDYGQGYWLSRPMGSSEFKAFLEARN